MNKENVIFFFWNECFLNPLESGLLHQIELETSNFGYLLFFISVNCVKFEPDRTFLVFEIL